MPIPIPLPASYLCISKLWTISERRYNKDVTMGLCSLVKTTVSHRIPVERYSIEAGYIPGIPSQNESEDLSGTSHLPGFLKKVCYQSPYILLPLEWSTYL